MKFFVLRLVIGGKPFSAAVISSFSEFMLFLFPLLFYFDYALCL